MQEILNKLKQLKRDKKYIALSLWPPPLSTTIQREDNRMYINEGRDGKFEGVSEAFYDEMVNKFDSRYKNK